MTQCDTAICCLISNQVPEPLYFAEGKSKIVHSEFQQYTNCIFLGHLAVTVGFQVNFKPAVSAGKTLWTIRCDIFVPLNNQNETYSAYVRFSLLQEKQK